MSPTAAARQPKPPAGAAFAGFAGLLSVLCVAQAGLARAEPPTALLFVGTPPGGSARWKERLRDRRVIEGEPLLDVERWAAGLQPALPRARLSPLARIERLLAEASTLAAGLQEDQALGRLAEAAELAEQLGDVPGAAAWNAEVQLRLGVVAAQAGLGELARVALGRAASLDPARALEPAEAPPRVVALAARIRAEVASAPEATLPVLLPAAAPDARVHVDDVDRGALPAELHLRAGLHVVRVEAPGHRPWGALVEVLPGRRPPLRVALAPDPARAAAAHLAARAHAGDLQGTVAALAALESVGAPLRLLLLEASGGAGRAVVVRCDARGCGGPLRLAPGILVPDATRVLDTPASPRRLRAARAWLAQPARARASAAEPGPAWYLWPIAAGVVAGVATAALLLSREEEEPSRLRIVIDPAGIAEP